MFLWANIFIRYLKLLVLKSNVCVTADTRQLTALLCLLFTSYCVL